MSFCTVVFLLFLPTAFALHWLRPGIRWQNAVLLVASYVFYGWWDWRFCGLMFGSSVLDYLIAGAISREHRPHVRKRWLLGVVTVHLVVLGTFKYFGFFADSLAILVGSLGYDLPTHTASIVLPLGISFYTFQSMGYAIDVYRNRTTPARSLVQYLVFVSFFPQLVAGPIERAGALLPQFGAVRTFSHAAAVAGCRLMLWGFLKKMLLADNLAGIVNPIFDRATTASAGELMCATLAFGFQIYGDFSGYSDIAAGVGALFGVRLSRNFGYPYFARNLREFWRRWHITLSEWMKDYVFIPLGGSRGGTAATLYALVLTFLVSGLWHGADWRFVLWGAYHGLGIAVVHLWSGRGLQRSRPPAPSPPGMTLGFPIGVLPSAGRVLATSATFGFVGLGWVFFRARDTGEAFQILGRLLLGWTDPQAFQGAVTVTRSNAACLALLAAFVTTEYLGRARWDPVPWERLPRPLRWAGYTLLLWVVALFGTQRAHEFVYFQF